MRASILETSRILGAALAVSFAGSRRRLGAGLLELVPQLLFYVSLTVIVFILFGTVRGQAVPRADLAVFVLVVACIDSVGDALIFKGLTEYAAALRRGQTVHYLLAPGPALAKAVLLRWDVPMLALGAASGVAATVLACILHGPAAVALPPLLTLGAVVHSLLTSAFHVIQAWFDPTMPLAFGNPAARLYTKPLHLVVHGSAATALVVCVYPVYLISAFPASVATEGVGPAVARVGGVALAAGAGAIVLWAMALNRLVVRTCRRRQG